MNGNLPTRREALVSLSAVPLLTGIVQAEAAAESVCLLSTVEMARLIRTGKLSAREALAAHLKQIERVNPKVNAIVTLVPEMATHIHESDTKRTAPLRRSTPCATNPIRSSSRNPVRPAVHPLPPVPPEPSC